MHNIIFDMPSLHKHGSAYFDYLRLRKRYFVDILGWDIPHNDLYEMDQYDNPTAFYSLAVQNSTVLGGVRLIQTDAEWGRHTYMMRDALHNKIDGIPPHLVGEEIVSPQVWEMTRLVIDPDLRTTTARQDCLNAIGEGLHKVADSTACQEFFGLTAPTVARALRRLGYLAENVGESYRCACDGRSYGVMRIPVHQDAYALAAE